MTTPDETVELAASSERRAETQAKRASAAVSSAAQRHAQQSKKSSESVSQALLAYVRTAMAEGKTAAELSTRGDFTSVVKRFISRVVSDHRGRITKASDAGWLLGLRKAKKVLTALGKETPRFPAKPKNLERMFAADLRRVETEAVRLLTDRLAVSGRVPFESAVRGITQRLHMMVEAALKMYAAEAELTLLSGVDDLKKTWRTTSAVPCEHCRKLNGVTKKIGEPFKTAMSTYKDRPLMAPPMHPMCRCYLSFSL